MDEQGRGNCYRGDDLTRLDNGRSVAANEHQRAGNGAGGTVLAGDRFSGGGQARSGDGEDRGAAGWNSRRVVVVQREEETLAAIGDALRGEGLAVQGTTDGHVGLGWLRNGGHQLVVLDLAVPALHGLEACRALRAESDVPIMIVTARDSPADRVLGLEAGADDYLGEPFSIAELVSRVRAIMRRRRLDLQPTAAISRVGDVEIDFAAHRVLVAGEAVRLTPTEFRLLGILAREPGRPLSPGQILHDLWQTDHVGRGGACRTHISNLRRKIDADPVGPPRIVTVPRVGYLLRREGAGRSDSLTRP
jgi:DNA-binding response OmpR family regulator